jgi:S-adenosylmethionine:tRNA ribosyltransferase-isomerase
MVNRAKRRRPGQRFCFSGGLEGEIVEAPAQIDAGTDSSASGNEFRYLRFDSPIDDDWLDIHGHIPLPPYIKRDDEESDADRYQTIYADRTAGAALGPGASTAAPTAGLHFTEELLAQLQREGIETVFITLHVGPGTFLPVRTNRIEDHVMHEETYTISTEAAKKINAAKKSGRKIVAVGTTSVRTLESAWTGGENRHVKDGENSHVKNGEGTTSIFIYPGYRFNVVDALFTNFHTPGSTLLMLVSAFAGRELILESYREAVREKYRFFSYGDAMLIW